MKRIYDGLFKENALLRLILGLCTALALSNTVESSYVMGFSLLIVLVFSNVTISLIRNLIPNNVRIPVFILIIGTFVTILDLLMGNYTQELHSVLGIYLPLIVVNCLIMGRALAVASKNGVKESFLDAIGVGLGFVITLLVIGVIREFFGNNSLTIIDNLSVLTGFTIKFENILPNNNVLPFAVLKEPAGAFITLGFLMAFFKAYIAKKEVANGTN